MQQQHGNAIEIVDKSIFPRITWIRDVEQDPRITGGPLDLAKVMAVGADKYGRCDLTVRQIQERLVLRQSDGGYVPERTIKSWRTRLKKFGVVRDIGKAVGAGFAGPGQGRGGVWQLLGNGQSGTQETGNETGNGIARSTIAPPGRAIPPPKGEEVDSGAQVEVSEPFGLNDFPTEISSPFAPTTGDVVATREVPALLPWTTPQSGDEPTNNPPAALPWATTPEQPSAPRNGARAIEVLPWTIEAWAREAHERAVEVLGTPIGRALGLHLLGREEDAAA